MIGLPPHAPGMRVGLYGGSFNPAHAGHLHVATTALRRLRLDKVWWVVTPGNPLKDPAGAASMDDRMASARTVATDPAMVVTGFEAALGTRFTVDTVRVLRTRCPCVRFVWIMGADSLASFARWRGWRDIAATLPIAIVDRPGWTAHAIASRAGHGLARWRVPERDAVVLADCQPPAWTFLTGPRSSLSSTALRMRPDGVR